MNFMSFDFICYKYLSVNTQLLRSTSRYSEDFMQDVYLDSTYGCCAIYFNSTWGLANSEETIQYIDNSG